MLKRFFDILIGGVLLVLLAPVAGLVALVILVDMGRPVIFAQRRPGLNGAPFRMYKFRTMREANDAAGNPMSDELRLTRVGRLLRRSSLDELPELFNVLKGDMSLVGPRPLLMEYLDLYSSEQARRHEVRPGMTGWAQVQGRNALDWDERFRLDVWYVDNRSFILDAKILLLTVRTVVGGRGVARSGHATMPKFTGSK